MKFTPLILAICALTFQVSAQLNISYGTTNPDNGPALNGAQCMRIERLPSGTFLVYSTYNATSDNFNGLSTGDPTKKRFLAAYQPDGQIKWVRGVSTEREQTAWLTSSGKNVFFGSTVAQGTFTFGTEQVVVPPNSTAAVIGQYDTLGNFIRVFSLSQPNTNQGLYDLEAGPDGKLYALIGTSVTGNFFGLNIPVNGLYPNSLVLAVFDLNGNLQTVHPIARMAGLFCYFSLGFAPNQDILIGGFNVSAASLVNGVAVPENTSSVSRWRTDGSNVWVKPLTAGGTYRIYNICGAPDGHIGFAGTYIGHFPEGFPNDPGSNDVLVGKMNGDNGAVLWSRNGESDSNYPGYAYGIATDPESNLYINGNCHGTVFDNGAGCGDNGPYSVAFIARFNHDGTVGWAACESGGEGRDLIVMPDRTVFSVGTTATGSGISSTTYLNHWYNPTLSIQPLNSKYCQGDTLYLQWKIDRTIFPPNSYIWLDVFQGNSSWPSSFMGYTSGTDGILKYPLHSTSFPNEPTISIALNIRGLSTVRSAPFLVANTPIPYFADGVKQVCYNGDHWLKPVLQNKPPDLISWTPPTGLHRADSLAAQALKVKSPVTYRVTYTNTTHQCSATDTIRVVPYNFSVFINGPTQLYQAGTQTYNALKSGSSPFTPFQYQWYKDGAAFSQNNPLNAYINDTTRFKVVMTDKEGCARSDSLIVYYYPPVTLKGSVVNHDSTAALPAVPVFLWYLNGSDLNPTPKIAYTNAAGQFTFTTPYNSPVLIRAVPDSILYPEEAPAWYVRKYFVQNADPVWPTSPVTTLAPIRLFSPKMLPDSNGVLGGFIEKSFFTGSGGPAADLPLWLAGSDGQPLRYTVTDDNGYFRFEHLPYGDFYFFVDEWGIRNDLAPHASLSAFDPQKTQIAGTLLPDRLILDNAVDAAEPASALRILQVSPNPTTGLVSINTAGKAGRLEVFNTSGVIIWQQEVQATGEKPRIDLSALPAGAYWVRWNDGAGWQVAGVVKD